MAATVADALQADQARVDEGLVEAQFDSGCYLVYRNLTDAAPCGVARVRTGERR